MCVSVCLASVRPNVSLIVYVCLSILLHPWKRHLAETKTEDNWVGVEIYRSYFGMKLGDQDKSWGPHFVCKTCGKGLRNWSKCLRNILVSNPYGLARAY